MFKREIAELEANQKVRFSTGGYLYDIWWSDCNDGWMINVYDEDDDIFDEDGELDDSSAFDGGLCTGSAENAVLMFIGE